MATAGTRPARTARPRPRNTYARLAAGFAIGTTTAWRYVREAINLLAAFAEDLHGWARRAARFGICHPRRHTPPDRPRRGPKGLLLGSRHRHGVNVQVVADPVGRLVWASPALPSASHDLNSARTVGLVDALTCHNVMTFAVNRSHARIRALGERAVATLKTWKILAKLLCCPRRATTIVQAILVLQDVETNR